jgi:hypothetical protein
MIEPKDLERQSSEEIDEIIVEREKELQTANHHYAIVIEESHNLTRQMLEMRIRKNSNAIMVEKAKENVKRLESDLRILRSAFWAAKNQRM